MKRLNIEVNDFEFGSDYGMQASRRNEMAVSYELLATGYELQAMSECGDTYD